MEITKGGSGLLGAASWGSEGTLAGGGFGEVFGGWLHKEGILSVHR